MGEAGHPPATPASGGGRSSGTIFTLFSSHPRHRCTRPRRRHIYLSQPIIPLVFLNSFAGGHDFGYICYL